MTPRDPDNVSVPRSVLEEWRESVDIAAQDAEGARHAATLARDQARFVTTSLDRALAAPPPVVEPPPDREPPPRRPPPGDPDPKEWPYVLVRHKATGVGVTEDEAAAGYVARTATTKAGWKFYRQRHFDMHSHCRHVAPNAYLVDVLISNASVNPDGTGARGHVALDSLSIGFGEGWESHCERDTKWGVCTLPSRLGFLRTFAVWREGDGRAQHIATTALTRFPSREILTNYEEFPLSRFYQGGFGPNRDAVPNWDALAALTGSTYWSWPKVEARARGSYEALLKGAGRPEGFGAIGPFDPYGIAHGASAGGAGISTTHWNLGRYGLLASRVRMARLIERSPCLAWHAETGEPLMAADIAAANGGVFPHRMSMVVDADTREEPLGLPYWSGLEWVGTPTDAHRAQLDRLTDLNDALHRVNAPDNHDDQHLGRLTHDPEALAYAVDDPAARLWLGALWAHAECHWHVEATAPEGGVRPSYQHGMRGRFAGALRSPASEGSDPVVWRHALDRVRERGNDSMSRLLVHPPGRGDWNSREHWHVGLLACMVRDLKIANDARMAEWFAWLDTYLAYVTPDHGCMQRRPDPEDRPDGPARTKIVGGEEVIVDGETVIVGGELRPADTHMSPAPEDDPDMEPGYSAGHLFEQAGLARLGDAGHRHGWLPKSGAKLSNVAAQTIVNMHGGKPPFAGFIGYNLTGVPFPARNWGKGSESAQVHSFLFRAGQWGALIAMVRAEGETGALTTTDYVIRILAMQQRDEGWRRELEHCAAAVASFGNGAKGVTR